MFIVAQVSAPVSRQGNAPLCGANTGPETCATGYNGHVRAVSRILRIFSYVFEILLSLFMLALGIVGGDQLDLHGLLPWGPPSLAHWLIILSLIGIACTVLAITGWFRYIYPLWTLAVVVMLFRGFIFGLESFSRSLFSFNQSIWLIALALLAFIGSLTVLRRPTKIDRSIL